MEEERDTPATTTAANDESNDKGSPCKETYIVQIPKDQVYRIPPPENAELVDRNRENAQAAAASTDRPSQCFCWFFTIVTVIAFLATVAFCVWRFTLDPLPPFFAATHVDVKHPPASKKVGLLPGFQITLRSLNPNGVNDIRIEEGNAKLMYKSKEISRGRFPAMDHEAGKTRNIELVLIGSARGGLPKELQEASNPRRKNKKAVFVKLEMEMPMIMKTWIFNKVGVVKYVCDLELSSLGDDATLLYDKCRPQ